MTIITPDQFGAGQNAEVFEKLGHFIASLVRVAPQLAGHFLSGGTLEIKTVSGTHLKFGFAPHEGGIIHPGGIRPAGPVDRMPRP